MELFHKDKFNDAKDVVIPGTKERRSRTEENERLQNWMKETGKIPISYMRENNGIHVEYSRIFQSRIQQVLKQKTAIGADGRMYEFINPEELFPIGSDICVRAKALEDKHSDCYSLDFFI